MVWITSSLETPVGGVFLSVRRLVYHLGHGSPFKRAGLSEKTASFYKKIYLHLVQTNFSYFLASSPRMVEFICSNFGCSKRKVIVQSQPRLQSLLDRLHETKTKNAHKFSILYAPTWRGTNNTALFPLSDYDWNALNKFLKDHNVTIWLRLHPEFENSDHIQQFLSEQIRPLDSHAVPEIMDALDRFDLLITDYSSIYVDFLVLNRPVFFFPYDLKEYENTIGLIGPYEELTGGPLIFEFRDFLNQLANILNGKDDFREKRQILNRFFNGNLKAPCRENYRFVIDYLKRRA